MREFICGLESCLVQRENTGTAMWFSPKAMSVEDTSGPEGLSVYTTRRPVVVVVAAVVEKRPEPK